ncbi:MAG: hypothetical protein RBS43_06645 [Candidatus Cloacimonas sp.]|jgi:hypothetical protein|nr:hypothetical protein [Candidatus Cloacimonas sp.]
MKKLSFLLLILLLLLGLTNCGVEDADSIARRDIRDILYDISVDFNLNDIAPIMDHVHLDYLHKGLTSYNFNSLWLDRMAQFNLLEIEILYIEINGDYAIVHSSNKFSSASNSETLNEPEDSGDISYFRRDGGTWQIYGNQLQSKAEVAYAHKGNLLVCK